MEIYKRLNLKTNRPYLQYIAGSDKSNQSFDEFSSTNGIKYASIEQDDNQIYSMYVGLLKHRPQYITQARTVDLTDDELVAAIMTFDIESDFYDSDIMLRDQKLYVQKHTSLTRPVDWLIELTSIDWGISILFGFALILISFIFDTWLLRIFVVLWPFIVIWQHFRIDKAIDKFNNDNV